MKTSLLIVLFACGCLSASAATEPASAYLFAHFAGNSAKDEQVYFAVSQDGLNWTDLNKSGPVLRSTVGDKGVRDPSLLRTVDGKKFILLATDLRIANGKGWDAARLHGSTSLVFWESADLVTWSEPWRVDVAGSIPGAGCAWAPAAIYDDSTGDYFVYWATVSPINGVREARIYGAHTKDFRTFTPPELYIDRDADGPDKGDTLDTRIIEVKNAKYRYYRVSAGTQITLEGADAIRGSWTRIGDLAQLGYTSSTVGSPILFQYNQEPKWSLFVDQHATGRGYLPLVSTNLDAPRGFHVLPASDYSFGASRKIHGGILGITRREFEGLLAKWSGLPVVRLAPLSAPDRLIRHFSFQIRLEADVSPVEDSRWQLAPGLVPGPDHVTFRSVNFPDRNLVVTNSGLVLAPSDGSPDYAARATFHRIPGLEDPNGDSFRLLDKPNRYLIEQGDSLGVGVPESEAERRAATFTIRD